MPLGKYGRLPRREGYRPVLDTPRAGDYLASRNIPVIPDKSDWTVGALPPWPMFGNDRIGDCTIAAVGHLLESWTASEGRQATPPDASILAAYSAITGYDPATGANDHGADLLTVCEYWQAKGIAGNTLTAYAEIPASPSFDPWKQAIYLFGGLYVGLNLPRSAEKQFASGQEWDVAMFPEGIVGGHCVAIHGYDPEGVTLSTWGQLHRATWRFMSTYCDEAYALLNTAWCPPGQLTWFTELYGLIRFHAIPPTAAPNGLDWATLEGEIKSVLINA